VAKGRMIAMRAATVALLAGFTGVLGGCSNTGIKPIPIGIPQSEMSPGTPGLTPQSESPGTPGLFSGDAGEIVIYERK
jgi:hypothetical protein